MISLVSHFWPWWLAALAIGAATALAPAKRPRGRIAGWLVWFGLAFIVGLPVAFLRLLAGRAGLRLETGLALFAAFIAGAVIGALVSGRSLRDHEAWAFGLLPLALLWWGADALAGRSLELALERSAAGAIESAGGNPQGLAVAGRDILLPDGVAAKGIAHVPGARRIVEAAQPPAEGQSAPAAPSAPPAAPPAVADKPAPKDAESAGPETLRPPPPTGELDAAACQSALSATLAQDPIQFRRNSPSIRRVSSGTLEKATLYLKRCPRAKVEVRGFGEAGEREELARLRAERVVDYLVRMGVEPGRLAAASGKDKDAGGKRTIEFVVERGG